MRKSDRSLIKLFNPDSVAILGASRDKRKIGHLVLNNIIQSGFKGKIFPVNPNSKSVEGLVCYAHYKNLPVTPDLAIFAVPAELAITLLEDVALKGTKNILIFSAGFKEAGLEGERKQLKLQFISKKYGLNILGPNCLGFVNNFEKLNATFSRTSGEAGNLRFISQSGALASAIFDWADDFQLGFDEFITIGNKAVLNENAILRYWLKETKKHKFVAGLSNCRPIGMYLESVEDGREFIELAKKISLHDPIFILKPGKSSGARKAISSHTGSMVGDDAVLDCALKEAGVTRCDGVEDMFDLAKFFSWENAPEGPNVAVISNAGGPAVICSDFIEENGLKLAEFNENTKAELKKNLPEFASVLNPVDVLGDALSDRYEFAINTVLCEKNVHSLVVILTPQIMTEIELTAQKIAKLAKKYRKTVACVFMGGKIIRKCRDALESSKIPFFRYPERAIMALAKMWQWKKWTKQKAEKRLSFHLLTIPNAAKQIIKKVENDKRSVFSGIEASDFVGACGIKTPASRIVNSNHEAIGFGGKNWPVVLKTSSSALIHKADSGNVVTGISDTNKLLKAISELSRKIARLPKNSNGSIQIQKQIFGVEVIIGVKEDKNFGKVLMFGAGGALAELISDKNLAILPINKSSAEKLVSESRVFPLLRGYRGQKPCAIEKLVDLIVKLSNVAQSASEIQEIEINPVIVTEKEAYAVDPKIILKK